MTRKPNRAIPAPPTRLILLIDGRSYGKKLNDKIRFQQDLPQFCKAIAGEIHSLSALLKLKPDVDHDTIFNAYAKDVQLLDQRMRSIVSMAKSAIRHSVLYSGRDNRLSFDEQWKVVEQNIPAVAQGSLFNFTAEKAALPPEELLQSLQNSFRQGVDDLMRRMCFWFDLLVSAEFVGLVEFTSIRAGKYFYYRHGAEKEEVSSKRKKRVDVDESQPFGQRITYTTTEDTLFRHSERLELHEHHIVGVRQDSIADYAARVPIRVKRFLEEIPTWLLPHLVVVSGRITMESVTSRMVAEREEIESRVVDVWKGSPALVLGPFAFVGWSDDDLRDSAGVAFSKMQSAWSSARARMWRRVLFWTVLVAAGIVGFISFIGWTIEVSYQEDLAAHAAFVAERTESGQRIWKMNAKDAVVLPRGESFGYLGKRSNQNYFTFAVNMQESHLRDNRVSFVLNDVVDGSSYGSVNLGPDLGISAVMHILAINGEKVRFVLEYYQ